LAIFEARQIGIDHFHNEVFEFGFRAPAQRDACKFTLAADYSEIRSPGALVAVLLVMHLRELRGFDANLAALAEALDKAFEPDREGQR